MDLPSTILKAFFVAKRKKAYTKCEHFQNLRYIRLTLALADWPQRKSLHLHMAKLELIFVL